MPVKQTWYLGVCMYGCVYGMFVCKQAVYLPTATAYVYVHRKIAKGIVQVPVQVEAPAFKKISTISFQEHTFMNEMCSSHMLTYRLNLCL